MSSGLSPTLNGGCFASVFQEVPHEHSMGLLNGEDLRLFHLNARNAKFSYTDLESFLSGNIGQYVFSKAKIAEYIADNNQFSVGLDAWQTLARSLTPDNNALGEILLWAFLEQVLGAPKVMSKIELTQTGGLAQRQADAIHLRVDSTGKTSANIVFGTSKFVSNLRDAIDTAFNRVIEIENNDPFYDRRQAFSTSNLR